MQDYDFEPKPPPSVLVVMGVSGSGKSTIGVELARRLHWEFADGDAFHPPENVAKMRAGVSLEDADRWPWLAAIAGFIDGIRAANRHAVVACSALKRRYRAILIGTRRDVGLIYLRGSQDLIAARIAARHEHFMPASLLASQFAALEEPGPDEGPVTISVAGSPAEIVTRLVGLLRLAA